MGSSSDVVAELEELGCPRPRIRTLEAPLLDSAPSPFPPLSVFPGPIWGGVTRLWLAYRNLKADECQVIQALHTKHGERGSVHSFVNPCGCTESERASLIYPTVM